MGENIEGTDIGYFATFQVGTPPTDVNLLIDSGSVRSPPVRTRFLAGTDTLWPQSDLWMPSTNCTGCNHQTLGTNSSSTFVASATPWDIQFGTGEVSGTLCADNFIVAGMTLEAHKFGTTDVESEDFTDVSAGWSCRSESWC